MRSLIALAAVALVASVSAQTPLPANSPFAPAGAPASANAGKETLEFSGVSSMGKKTILIFKDTATKKQSWVPVGETSDGITVVSYDAKAEQAVVKINGAQKLLALRAASAPAVTAPATAPAPTGFATPPAAPVQPAQPTPPAAQPAGDAPAKPATPQTPAEQVKAETEARMLVSDLLEIGMAQRKAYEEAQRKSADGSNAQPASAQPTSTTQPTTPPPAPQPQPPPAQPGGTD
jgi:hypothetical protein